MNYCLKNKKRYEIFIWKFDKKCNIKRANCCSTCTMIAKKYNYNIYTFDEKMNKCSAIIDNPQASLYYQIKLFEKTRKWTGK